MSLVVWQPVRQVVYTIFITNSHDPLYFLEKQELFFKKIMTAIVAIIAPLKF